MNRRPPNPAGSESTTVVLLKPVKADAAELAHRRRQSFSQLVNDAVERELQRARRAGELEAAGV